MLFAASRVRNSAANPRDDEMPSLQVSVPGHATMSTMLPAPGWPRPTASKASNKAGQITPAYPADDKVLLHGGANRLTRKPPGNVSQGPELRGGDIAQAEGSQSRQRIRPAFVDECWSSAIVETVRNRLRALGSPVRVVVQTSLIASATYSVHLESCGRIFRSSITRSLNLSIPSSWTRNLIRARLRFFFSPSLPKTRAMA